MLEFKTDEEAAEFMKKRVNKYQLEFEGGRIEARIYGPRLQFWRKEKREAKKDS